MTAKNAAAIGILGGGGVLIIIYKINVFILSQQSLHALHRQHSIFFNILSVICTVAIVRNCKQHESRLKWFGPFRNCNISLVYLQQ